jgi:hypothetical protein
MEANAAREQGRRSSRRRHRGGAQPAAADRLPRPSCQDESHERRPRHHRLTRLHVDTFAVRVGVIEPRIDGVTGHEEREPVVGREGFPPTWYGSCHSVARSPETPVPVTDTGSPRPRRRPLAHGPVRKDALAVSPARGRAFTTVGGTPPPHPEGGDMSATRPRPPSRPPRAPQAVHDAVICTAAPAFALSATHGQILGNGMDGFYQSGCRALARCEVQVGGRPPVPVQGMPLTAGRARFTGLVPTTADPGPDATLAVERLRTATGTERVTVHNTGLAPVRLPLEIRLGTDLAMLSAVAAGRPGRPLAAAVRGGGLRWSDGRAAARVTARPTPDAVVAAAGLLRWDLRLPPGGARTVELHVLLEKHGGGDPTPTRHRTRSASGGSRAHVPVTLHIPAPRDGSPTVPWSAARAEGDDPRLAPLLENALDDLAALRLRDPEHPADVHLAAGAPWRLGLSSAEALWAARLLLPLGTRLAVGTLRTLARLQDPRTGRIPGPTRDGGPHLPPVSADTEATPLYVTLLSEARRWGLPDAPAEQLVSTAANCLRHIATDLDDGGWVTDPVPGRPARCESQAHAYRAMLHGADLLDAFDRPGASEWRDRAADFRIRFLNAFWRDDPAGGRPVAAILADGTTVPYVGAHAAHLLDTGLGPDAAPAPGLLDPRRARRLARLLTTPALDSGWGLRSLATTAPGHNPFGHRSGAVRVLETAVAVAGMAATGHETEAVTLLRGLLDAAHAFRGRLPEMFAGHQRLRWGAPVPHPTACRPAAVAAASIVHLLATAVGLRPDVPGGLVAVRPLASAPLGAFQLTGLCVAQRPFSVRISEGGMAVVEEAAPGLRLRT